MEALKDILGAVFAGLISLGITGWMAMVTIMFIVGCLTFAFNSWTHMKENLS
jgi:hypothetical protein